MVFCYRGNNRLKVADADGQNEEEGLRKKKEDVAGEEKDEEVVGKRRR